MNVLEVNHVSIRYMTGDFKDIGLKEYIVRRLKRNYHVTEFWADKDVTFSLEKGDMLGIIGTNGAGKSTLLKALSGIMTPTKGYVKREGMIAALLELGSGFDGDLTVRENTYLRGAMLGYTRKFMNSAYDQIIDFAELKEFEDRPFKQLSSGMKSRLAFSIASLVNPDILILDEVLSVGDGAFQQKSAKKMKEIIQGGATTILVAHDTRLIRSMCNKILWLHRGEQIAFGDDVKGICDRYEAFLQGDMTQLQEKPDAAETYITEKEAEETANNIVPQVLSGVYPTPNSTSGYSSFNSNTESEECPVKGKFGTSFVFSIEGDILSVDVTCWAPVDELSFAYEVFLDNDLIYAGKYIDNNRFTMSISQLGKYSVRIYVKRKKDHYRHCDWFITKQLEYKGTTSRSKLK